MKILLRIDIDLLMFLQNPLFIWIFLSMKIEVIHFFYKKR